ncbi:MAG: DUF218 domain-containing protein [Clostridiales bacterium]|nr:DUF218 domain-containing protein [Clostridiales bacterium]
MKKTKGKIRLIKILLGLLSIGTVGAISLFGINQYVKRAISRKIITPEEAAKLQEIDCILVLGAGVWNNSRPSFMLEDRLLRGIELYETGVSNRLLMSGDHGRKDYDEVNVMKQFAMEAGVPSEHIFMDHAGFSTYESLYRARDVFEADKIVLVTQGYHMYRALYIAKKLGLEAYGVTSDQRQYVGQDYREAREALARVKDFFYTLVRPKPTFLGDTIPVSGNGDITNDR